MAVQTQTGVAAITRPAFKCVSLTILALTLFYSVYLITQPGVQPFVVHEHETVFTFLLLWIRTCHKKVAKLGNWFTLHAIQELGAGSPYLLTDSMDHTKTLVARASDIDNSPLGYAQPSFPFNILPGRVETRCQNYSGYALERCKVDVKTRTQLFITLMVIFSLVILCIVLITILTCMRRIKARRTAKPAKLPTRKSKRQPRATFITASKKPLVLGRNLTEKPSRRGIDVRQSLDGDEAVEADERGIDDQDIPVTMDGMTDGWMQWIRQRANMVCIFVVSLPIVLGHHTNIVFSNRYLAALHLEKRMIVHHLSARQL